MLYLKEHAEKQHRASSYEAAVAKRANKGASRNCIPVHSNPVICVTHGVLYDGRLSMQSLAVSRLAATRENRCPIALEADARAFRDDGASPEKCNFPRARASADPSADQRQKFNLRHHRRTRAGVRFGGDG